MRSTKFARIVLLVLLAINAMLHRELLIGALHRCLGDLNYLVGIAAAPLLNPVILVLPWYSAWTDDAAAPEVILLWGLSIAALCALALCVGALARLRHIRKTKMRGVVDQRR